MSARNSVQPAALDSSLVMEASRQSLPRCISKTQEEAALSHRNSPSPSHRASRAPQLTDMPEPISRAVSMFNTYPLMQVAGTAYQNAFNCASRRRYSSESIMESSQLMTDAREESLRLEDSTTEMRTATSDANMVRLSTAIKRAAMWQTILVTALAQSRVAQDYRTRRLRSVLERLLLPVVLMRRELTGSIISTNAMAKRRMSSFPAKISAGSAESDPNGGYIKSHYHLFDSFGSSLLMQHLAESMVRQRYLPGEIIIRAGEPMQQAMYFIVSGKVEARREFQEHGATRIDKSVVSSGEFFGGILRTTCMFDSTYKTISQCIVWVLAARDFQRIFKNFADDTMRNMFVEELRRYCHEKRLLELYPMAPSLLYQVPVYRKLNHDLQAYVEQFEPIVKVRGEPLFCQGDAPGDVYVLVEGVVERSVKGPDNRYASGVSQLIAPVACSMANRYRYVLLGEEPHILPGTQKYRCIVHSRTALFYRISGDHFVNALLDDAKFYVLLRERLTALIRTQMKLDPSCLAFAPLFRDFPTASLAAIAQAAEPRVVWRSLSLCEPGQHIKDVFLVIAGDVRDTRNFGHRPTGRLPTPPPACDSSSDDDDSPRGHRLGFGGSSKRGKKREKRVGFLPGRAAGKLAISTGAGGSATAMGKNGSKKAQPTGNVSRDELPEEPNGYDWFFSDSEEDEDDQESPPEAGRGLATTTSMSIAARTTVGSMGMHTATHITFPEELHELNPALPIQPAKRFVFTCGGGWEGLLVEKWPHGWEATTTTEVWAIPTLKMRTEYASFPKSTQSAILHAARLQQKESLGLASIIVARIPPLSAYMPRDRSLAVAAAADASKSGKDGKRATSAKSGRRGGSRSKRVADGRSNSNSASRLQRQSVDSNNGGSIFGMRPQHSDSLVSLVDQNSPPPTDHKKSVAATAAPSAAAPLKGAVKNTSSPKAAAKAKDAATPKKKKAVVADDGLPALPAKKIDIPRFGKRKPAAGEADASGAESAPVSQNLIAIYNGDFREDDPAFSHIVRELGPIKARARSPQPGASGAMARTLPLVPWPNGSRPATHWFRDVPTFTPLPGTMGSRNFNLTAPVYNTNTSLLTLRHGRRYRDVLEQQTDFFTSTTASMHRGSAILRETAGGRTSPASAMNGTLGDTRGLVDRSDLPKRHAMTM